jgi:hypothetical protein
MPSALPAPTAAARQALLEATTALEAAAGRGAAWEMSLALQSVASCHRVLQASASAESCLALALRWARACACTDLVVDLLCELCETAADLAETLEARTAGAGEAARERAREGAFEASIRCAHVCDPGWEIKVLLRISDVLDRCGDRDHAIGLQTRALRLISGAQGSGAPDPALVPSLGRLADG